MKMNKKFTIAAIYFGLLCPQSTSTYFDDNFEEEFIKKIQNFEKNIQATLHQFQHKIFQDLENSTKTITDHIDQQNLKPQQQTPQYYQQRMNSLAFANNDKAIKITEQINKEAVIYSILVTNKKAQLNNTNEPSGKDTDIATELQNLQMYIKNSFHSNAAEKTLEECINAIAQQNKNKSVNISSSNENNQTLYTIEIINKQDHDAHDDNLAETTKGHKKNKKKKANFFTPHKKAPKNS
ncbi:MAG: hypothetical protein JO129_02270 [Candidatus Dependentiae bacterium]|nr:hypothetical protein [Candidatus Dependentiae bacterium]